MENGCAANETAVKSTQSAPSEPSSPTSQQQGVAIPLPPPPPKENDQQAIPALVEGGNKEEKTSSIVEINGQSVPAAIAGAFAQQTKDKQPFAYISGETAAVFTPDSTRPSTVRREERKSQSKERSVPKVESIVVESESEGEKREVTTPVDRDKTPQVPIALAPPTESQSSVQSVTSPSAGQYRPITFVPSSFQPITAPYQTQGATQPSYAQPAPFVDTQYRQTIMPSMHHLQYNTPINLYSAESAQQAWQQSTGIQQTAPAPQRPQWNAAQSETYKAVLEVEDDKQHGGRPLTPHSARMEEQPGDIYAGRYHGFVNAQAQSPSFRRLQAVTNAGDWSEAQEHVRAYERRQLQGGQQSEPQRTQTPSFAVAIFPSLHAHLPTQVTPAPERQTPLVAQFDHGVEDRPLDPSLAQKIAEAERPRVPPATVPSWARKANEKHGKWEAAVGGGYDPRHTSETRSFPPPEPYWQQQVQAKHDKWQHHYGQLNVAPGSTGHSPRRSQTPTYYHQSRYDIGGTDYGMYSPRGGNPRDRARSVDPSHHYGSAPPRYVHKYRTANEREWLKPYIAPNLHYERAENYGSIISNQDALLSRARCSPQNITQMGTYYGPPEGFKAGHRLGYSPSGYSSSYQQFAPRALSGASVPVQQPQLKYKTDAWHTKGSMAQEVAQRTAQVQTPQQQQPYTGGLSPRQREMGTSFLPEHAQSAPHMPASGMLQIRSSAPTWRSTSPSRATPHNQGSHTPTQQQSCQRPLRTVATYQTSTAPPKAIPLGGGNTEITQWHTTKGPNWQVTTGANTKASTSGEYVDQDGNKVTYNRELYTSNDPGGKGEYSMLTEEERKVMEEPLQPGVISRHITTKYYKKSTFANQQTTTTSVPADRPLAITTGDERAIKTGVVRALFSSMQQVSHFADLTRCNTVLKYSINTVQRTTQTLLV